MASSTTAKENSTSTASPFQCGACHADNDSTATFCAGCGHHLSEPCSACAKPVRLAQKFCGGCGQNLESEVRGREERFRQDLVDAVKLAKEHRFDQAIGLLASVIKKRDYRMAEVQAQAATAIEKIKVLGEQSDRANAERRRLAAEASEKQSHGSVIKLLGEVPDEQLDEASRQLLRTSREFVAEVDGLESEAKQAIDSKDWLWAGGVLGRLLKLVPDQKVYQKLAGDVSKRILASAQSLFEKGRFGKAMDYLVNMPETCRSDATDELLRRAEDLHWMQTHLRDQPFATPALFGIAKRLAKEASQSSQGAICQKELAQKITLGRKTPRTPLAVFNGSVQSTLGGSLAVLSQPGSVDWSDVSWDSRHAGVFSTACGLAFGGLDVGRHCDPLWEGGGGIIGSLRKKRVSGCWGIDVGASHIRAVLLEKDPEGAIKAKQLVSVAHQQPLSRSIARDQQGKLVLDSLAKLMDSITLEGQAIYVSYRSVEAIKHFVRLPPVPAKQAAKLLQEEAKKRIPLDFDDLAVATWMADVDGVGTEGIPAAIVATRKQPLETFVDMLAQVGIKPNAIVEETFALARFASVEFADEMNQDGGKDDACAPRPTVLMLDFGSDTTKAIVVSDLEFWTGQLEAGGDSITSALIKSASLTHEQAELAKRNPASLANPSLQWTAVDQLYPPWQSRLKGMLADAKKFSRHFDLRSTWCTGGAAMTHNLLKHVLQQDES